MMASTIEALAPITAAGAGPSSAIASTMARNEPVMRTFRTSTVMTSLPMQSTKRSPTSAVGCQSLSRDRYAVATMATAKPHTRSPG